MAGKTAKSDTKTQYDQLKSKMWKDSETAEPPKTAIKPVNVQTVARKNMFLLLVNADYTLHSEQRQQTNGQTKFMIDF